MFCNKKKEDNFQKDIVRNWLKIFFSLRNNQFDLISDDNRIDPLFSFETVATY